VESKAIITETAAESFQSEAQRLADDVAAHAALGLEAHADSRLLIGTPYLDDSSTVVTPDTFRFRTVKSDGSVVLVDLPVFLYTGQPVTDVVEPPAPPEIQPSLTETTQAAPSSGSITSLVSQAKLDEFQIDIDLLEKGVRDHIRAQLGLVHVPAGGLMVVAGSTYANSEGITLGNATLQVTIGPSTYYVPARIIT